MGILGIYNSIGSGITKVTTPIKDIFSSTQTYSAPKPVVNSNPDDAIYEQASQSAKQKYGVTIPPYFLKAVRQQESSGIVNPNDYGRSFGLVNADNTNGAKTALGSNYIPDTSLLNSATNAANYAASRAHFKDSNGTTTIDLSTPDNLSKLYVQRYVGLLPGQSRKIGGQMISYDKVKSLFEEQLKNSQK